MQRTYTVEQLANALIDLTESNPAVKGYEILIAADHVLGPSPWEREFSIRIRNDCKCVSLHMESMT